MWSTLWTRSSLSKIQLSTSESDVFKMCKSGAAVQKIEFDPQIVPVLEKWLPGFSDLPLLWMKFGLVSLATNRN